MAHDEKSAAHDAHHDEIAHPLSVGILVAVWMVLMFFTWLTTWASMQGLGSQTSFIIAMIIATVKAGLVMSVFMHLWWDRRMNVFTFLGSFLFVMLFIGMALTDKTEYNQNLLDKQADDLAAQGGK